MRVYWLFLTMLLAVTARAHDNFGEMYFSKDEVALTPQEKAAVALSTQWQATHEHTAQPFVGGDGSVRFIYGTSWPRIVCAVLQICDVELQPGENVQSINLGDTARWVVEPALTGTGDFETQHLMIKPLDVGLHTSLVVTTNRRTYHLRLRSHRTQFIPHVAFTYPDEALKKWHNLKTREEQQQQQKTIPETGEYLDQLDFNYTIEGEAPWKPVRVYNDGQKTILEMPAAMAQTEAPTLLVIRSTGGLWQDDEHVMVNYRVQGNRYIVDTVFAQALLITGIGNCQQRITITRENP